MIERLVLFGATGDLAGRFLLPALAALRAAGRLPDDFAVAACAREELAEDAFKRLAAERLAEHAGDLPASAREWLERALSYRPVDVADAGSVADVVGDEPEAAYLALPPSTFPDAVRALAGAGLEAGSRVVLEKPFGEDLDGAAALNRLLEDLFGDAVENVVFRVDHVLGMATTQNLLGLRLAGGALEAVWDGEHVAEIEILWEETLALEDRAGYYDTTGALKDVVQNHMLQLLALAAMEPSDSLDADYVRDRKVEALRALTPLSADSARARTRRARYAAGRVDGRDVPAYVDEQGVDPKRGTETFAEVTLASEAERWAGTKFVLRAGKALGRRRKGIVLRFREPARTPFAEPAAKALWIGIDGPEDAGFADAATVPSPETELPAYARVLLEVLEGRSALSVRGDEAEQAWRVVTPVLEAWSNDAVPLEEYPAGSEGP
jgi:glucose-6-phosphate 1-dehydrogenase